MGILIFEGMKVGVLPGDFTVSVDEAGAVGGKLIISTAYNVLPVWVRIAYDNLSHAHKASEQVAARWGTDEGKQKDLLIAELNPSLQVFVSCGIVLKGGRS